MDFGPEAVADWARAALVDLEPADGVTTVRLRLIPSPLPRGETVSVTWDGDRTPDALHDQALEQLAGLDLADRVRVRLEQLDGSGHAIAGAGASTTLSRPRRAEVPTMPRPAPAPAPQEQEHPRVLDHDTLDLGEDDLPGAHDPLMDPGHALAAADAWAGLVPRPAGTEAPAAAELYGQLGLRAIGLGLLASHRTNQLLLANSRRDQALLRDLVGEVRRCAGVRDGLLEEVLPSLITAVGAAADSRAEAQVARLEGDHARELAEVADDDPAARAIQVLQEARGMLAGARLRARGPQGPAQPGGAAQGPAQPSPQAQEPGAPAPGPQAPQKPTAGPADQVGAAVGAVLSGELPAGLAARALVGRLDPAQLDHARALARAILAASGDGDAA